MAAARASGQKRPSGPLIAAAQVLAPARVHAPGPPEHPLMPLRASGWLPVLTCLQWEVQVLSFNDLLVLAGIDPVKVRLVRHQDNRVRPGRLYEAWRNDRDSFDAYQSVQRKARFQLDDLLASFVVTEARKTVFVGLYRVGGAQTLPAGSFDPLVGHDTSGSSK